MKKIVFLISLLFPVFCHSAEQVTIVTLYQSGDYVKIDGRDVQAIQSAQFTLYDNWLSAEVLKLWNKGSLSNDQSFGDFNFKVSFDLKINDQTITWHCFKDKDKRRVIMYLLDEKRELPFEVGIEFFNKLSFLKLTLTSN